MMSRLILGAVFAMVIPISLLADTLVLRNGTRIEGQLLSVHNGVIEFEERRGFGSGRRVQIERDEVVRIEFDARRKSSDPSSGRPFGMRERTAIVNANAPWTDTSVDVRAGQTIYFEATGEIRWGAIDATAPRARTTRRVTRIGRCRIVRPQRSSARSAASPRITFSSGGSRARSASAPAAGCFSVSTTTSSTTTRAPFASSFTTDRDHGVLPQSG